ncbi:unnamed protein product [Brassicogethes aeneus]|uniref:Uncharacterized protein n=1 Tax=Brassicogethes aeneus TaxID=1431903 RepID=A0A9P0B6D0_BRAAE|nr:unnamed protein product [Brassicogethes aeneus]
MEEFLKNINSEHLLPTFLEHNISILQMETLFIDKDILKELIPSIGDRIKFIKEYEKFKELPQITYHEVLDDGMLTTSTFPLTSTLTSDSESEVIVLLENKQVSKKEDFDFTPNMPDFDLTEVLNKAPMGPAILLYYKKHNILNNTLRGHLVDIIMRHIFDFHVKHRLAHKDYLKISDKIQSLFPRESGNLYYIAGIKKSISPNNKSVCAKGKLIDKAKNLIFKGGYARPTRKRKIQENETLLTPNIDFNSIDSYLWLKTGREPWSEVVQHWKQTIGLRQNCTVAKVFEFIETWPILKDIRSYSLKLHFQIESDFEDNFINKRFLLIKNWDSFINNIIQYKSTDADIDILNINQLTESSKTVAQISLLTKLVPPKGRNIIKNKHWKFSTQESTDSIITHAYSAAQIQEIIDLQKNKAVAKNIAVQPYLLTVGPLDAITTTYIIIDTITYETPHAWPPFEPVADLKVRQGRRRLT